MCKSSEYLFESEDYLEEQWLFEAISETYIPLLKNFKKLEDEKGLENILLLSRISSLYKLL